MQESGTETEQITLNHVSCVDYRGAYPWVLDNIQEGNDVRPPTEIVEDLYLTFDLLLFDRLWGG